MATIIILGAGASGLYAARLLCRRHTVTVIEARERIGGRIHTIQDGFSSFVETGAEFIHGKYPLSLRLAKEAGANVTRIGGNRYEVLEGEAHKGDLLDDAWGKLGHELKKLKTDMTMSEFLKKKFSAKKYEVLRQKVRGFAEGYDTADITKVSAFSLRDEWEGADGEHQYRITGGYGLLMDYLQQEIIASGNGRIVTGEPITKIKWTDGFVEAIGTSGKLWKADKVIVTASIGVLKSRTIKIEPSLPHVNRAVRDIGFGGVIKFLVEFDEPFWKAKFKDVGFLFSDAPVPTWWTQYPADSPLLTGWLGGPKTNVKRTQVQWKQLAIRSLCNIFSMKSIVLEKMIRQVSITDWVSDPWSRGAYSYAMLGTAEAVKLLMMPVQDTIFFAGEGIYDGDAPGTVEAALESGLRVVKQLNQTHSGVKPQS